MGVLVDITPLRVSPDFRRLWSGQAISLVGTAQVSARYWVSDGGGTIGLAEAKQLISRLAWRGIRGFPLTEH